VVGFDALLRPPGVVVFDSRLVPESIPSSEDIMSFQTYIEEMRPKSWLKNVFVFIPLVFSLSLTDTGKLASAAVAFAAFCLVSSAVYTFNDVCDAEKDAAHPTKRRRPVASGALSKQTSVTFSILLALGGLAAAFTVNLPVGLFAVAYIAVNLCYTLLLKRQPIFDVFCIAAGFVLRTFAGGFACGAFVSDWLFLTIAAMSLFMAFGKRRGEMLKVGADERRDVLKRYDLAYLDGMMFVCAGLAIVFYALWAMNRGANMLYTVPIVIFIVCKYLLLVHGMDSHGDPTEVIFADKTLLAACAVYILAVITLLYLGFVQ
jgi:4-hydroxybenzoate polyprenyltransferase